MSFNETKTVVRVEIPELYGKSKTELYYYFKSILGESSYVDEWEGEVEYFSYDEEEFEIVPVHQYNRETESNVGKVGVDYILSYKTDYYAGKGKDGFTFKELNEIGQILEDKFGIDPENCKLFSYTWYNGADEPIKF
jgi:hypothetical protein